MKKFILIISGVIVCVFILFIAFFFFMKSLLTPERVKDFTENLIEKNLQAQAEIKKIEPYIGFFKVGIKVQKINVTRDKKRWISAEEVELRLKILPLILKKTFEIHKVYIKKPYVEFRIEKKVKRVTSKKVKASEPRFLIVLKDFKIEDAQIKILEENKKIYEIKNFNLEFVSHSLSKEKINFNGRGSLFVEKPEFINKKINFSFKFDFDILSDLLNISYFSFKIKNLEIRGSGKIEDIISGEPKYSINIRSDKIALSDLTEFAKLNNITVKGFLNMGLRVKGNTREVYPKIYGKINSDKISIIQKENYVVFDNIEINFKGRKGILRTELNYNGNKGIFKSSFDIKKLSFRGDFNLKGNLEKITGKKVNFDLSLDFNGNLNNIFLKGKFKSGKSSLNFNINAQNIRKKYYLNGSMYASYLNLNELLPDKKGEKEEKKVPELILLPNLSLNLNVKIEKLIRGKEKFENVSFILEIDKKGIKIKNLKGSAYKGRIEGEIGIYKGSIIVDSKLKGKNLDFSQILKNYKFLPGELRGRLNFETDANFDFENISESLNARNTVLVFKGEWRGNPVLNKIADFLEIPEFKNIKFRKINAEVEIKKGWIEFPDFTIEGEDFLIFPYGKASIKGELNMKVKIAFKGNLSKNLRKFSSLSNYFINKKGNFELLFIVKGNYKNPQVKLDLNYFKNKLKKEIKEKAKKEIEKKIEEGLKKLREKFGF